MLSHPPVDDWEYLSTGDPSCPSTVSSSNIMKKLTHPTPTTPSHHFHLWTMAMKLHTVLAVALTAAPVLLLR